MDSGVPSHSHFYTGEEATPRPSNEEEPVDVRFEDLRRLPLSDPSQTARVHRTIAQRRRLQPAKAFPTAACRAAVENQPIFSFTFSTSPTSAGSASTQVSRQLSMASTSDWNTPQSAEEEGRIIKMDENGPIIPDDAVDLDDMVIPKIESPGEDAAMALIENHRRSVDSMSPLVAKRPRGRPRKHPLPSESSNKIAKGRSKTGCITCRKRKKKCDETKPRCMNCEKNAVLCEGYHERTIWKSGKEKAEEGATIWTNKLPEMILNISSAQLHRVTIPHIRLQPVIHGVETASDRIFFEHYVFRLSAVLTVEGPQKNAFKDMLLPMAVKHLGLMHSILALSSSSIDYGGDYGREILARYSDVNQRMLEDRAQFHQEEAVKEFLLDIKRQETGVVENAVLSVRYGQMLCFIVKGLADGESAGEHRIHLQAYQKLIRETPPEDSPFMDFITEYFQFHISLVELVSPPHEALPLDEEAEQIGPFILPPSIFQQEAGRLLGIQDNLFYFMSKITRLRNKIRHNIEQDVDPIVDYNSLYRASQIDAEIRGWQSVWPEHEIRHVTGLLYKQMLWVYLWRTIYPPKATTWQPDPKITEAVNGALKLLELVPSSDPCQTLLLAPTFIIGCAAFETEQRMPIRKSIATIRNYTTLKNTDRALEVLEEVWRCMDAKEERSWDWQGIASGMGMDFLAT